MKTKLARRIITIVIIAAFIASTVILIIQSNRPRTGDVMFKMHANSSSGEHYRYEFDRDDILRETDSYESRFFLNFGPGYNNVWEFDIIGEGELTVNWTNTQGGWVNEANCFTEVYRVEDGKCKKIFDSRKN